MHVRAYACVPLYMHVSAFTCALFCVCVRTCSVSIKKVCDVADWRAVRGPVVPRDRALAVLRGCGRRGRGRGGGRGHTLAPPPPDPRGAGPPRALARLPGPETFGHLARSVHYRGNRRNKLTLHIHSTVKQTSHTTNTCCILNIFLTLVNKHMFRVIRSDGHN